MKKLPPIHGLLRAAALKRAEAMRKADASMARNACPREAHENRDDADRCAVEAGQFDTIAAEDIDVIIQIETTAEFLRASKNQSALRTLALRKLEEAAGHLRREVGDTP